MPKAPSADLIKRASEIDESYLTCRQAGRHAFPVRPQSIKRTGRMFEIAQQCEHCGTWMTTFRSTIDGSLIRDKGRVYKYPENYQCKGFDVVDIRNTLWLNQLQQAELEFEAAASEQAVREEAPIPQRKRRRNPTRRKKEEA